MYYIDFQPGSNFAVAFDNLLTAVNKFFTLFNDGSFLKVFFAYSLILVIFAVLFAFFLFAFYDVLRNRGR